MAMRWDTIMEKDKTWYGMWYGDVNSIASLLAHSQTFETACKKAYGNNVNKCDKACEWSFWLHEKMDKFKALEEKVSEHVSEEDQEKLWDGFWEYAEQSSDFIKEVLSKFAEDVTVVVPYVKSATSAYWAYGHHVRGRQLEDNNKAPPEGPKFAKNIPMIECAGEHQVVDLDADIVY